MSKWILVGYPLTEGALLGSFLLKQRVTDQGLTSNEMIGAKLSLVVYTKMM